MAPHALDFTQAAAAAAKLFTLIDRPSNIDPFDDGGEKPEELVSSIKFEDVSFAYPTRPDAQVLSNFSLEFPAGKVTALVVSSTLDTLRNATKRAIAFNTRDRVPLAPARAPLLA